MKDLTTGNVQKQLFFFALPILIGNLFQQFYNMADSIIVGKILGTQSLAAVGFCFQFNLILIALSMGLTLGMSILISRFFGAKEPELIRTVIDTGFLFSLLLSICVTIAGLLFTDKLIVLFQVPLDTVPLASTYLRILFLGVIPLFLYNTLTNILRGLGDSKRPVYFLAIAAILNVLLDLLFVKICSLGIAGAALATVIAQLFSFIGIFLSMQLRYPHYRVRLHNGQFDVSILKQSLKLGIPSMMQQLCRSIGFLSLQGMVNGFGTACMAAYAATQKIDSFALLPNLNLGQALSNFTAQNRGAKKEARAKSGFHWALILGWAITITISCIVIPLAPVIMNCFSNDTAVISIGVTYIRIVSSFYFIETAMQMLNGILIGYEKPLMPLISTIVSLLLMQVPAAFLLSHFTPLGFHGIWLATPYGWIGGVIIRVIYYRKTVASN